MWVLHCTLFLCGLLFYFIVASYLKKKTTSTIDSNENINSLLPKEEGNINKSRDVIEIPNEINDDQLPKPLPDQINKTDHPIEENVSLTPKKTRRSRSRSCTNENYIKPELVLDLTPLNQLKDELPIKQIKTTKEEKEKEKTQELTIQQLNKKEEIQLHTSNEDNNLSPLRKSSKQSFNPLKRQTTFKVLKNKIKHVLSGYVLKITDNKR